MGYFKEDPNGYDADGFRNRANTVYQDTVAVQVADPDVDYVGSSTVKRIDGANLTNEPSNFDTIIPEGAKLEDGIIVLGDSNPA